MSAGRDALAEAARLETARVYGGVVRESIAQDRIAALEAQVLLRDARTANTRAIERAIAEGIPTADIVDIYGTDQDAVREIRKRLMAEGAA